MRPTRNGLTFRQLSLLLRTCTLECFHISFRHSGCDEQFQAAIEELEWNIHPMTRNSRAMTKSTISTTEGMLGGLARTAVGLMSGRYSPSHAVRSFSSFQRIVHWAPHKFSGHISHEMCSSTFCAVALHVRIGGGASAMVVPKLLEGFSGRFLLQLIYNFVC